MPRNSERSNYKHDDEDARVRLGAAQVENTTDAQYKLGSFANTEYENVMLEITQAVYQLAHASGHYMSKKRKRKSYKSYETIWRS